MMKRHTESGFTLVEGVITIVLLGIAMVTLVSFLFPQVERSAEPHYQARSAAMADAIFNEILARHYDQQSDPYGNSVYRCDEKNADDQPNPCTVAALWGPDTESEATDSQFANDVDDFIGCWGNQTQCPNVYVFDPNKRQPPRLTDQRGELTALMPMLSPAEAVDYTHIHAVVNVEPVATRAMKKITLTIVSGRYGTYHYTAYRGNY